MINDLWYKNAVVYCLSVESYMDANGDGRGDFEGLTRRLDYLQGLGITTLWLMPFQTSPRRDHGYDVSDYYNVDERFGTLGDFVEFTHAAEQRGMRVHPFELRFPSQESHGRHGLLINLLAEDHSEAGDGGEHCILLEPYGYRWFRVGGLDYLLRRSVV